MGLTLLALPLHSLSPSICWNFASSAANIVDSCGGTATLTRLSKFS